MTNEELLSTLKKLVSKERALNIAILRYLCDVEKRKLYLELGYTNLFKFAVKELGYSEDEAYRRISAMRLIGQVPEVEKKIESGTLGLTNAAKIQSFCKMEKGMSQEAKVALVAILENKSTREVERELAKRNPQLARKEKVRVVAEDKMELRMMIDSELKTKLDQLKALLSHKNPHMTYQELLAELAELGLQKWDPARGKIRRNVSGAKKRKSEQMLIQARLPRAQRSRYIPAAIKREIWRRDQGQCTYINPQTKNRCDSRHLLQIDHIHPYSIGGAHEVQNLRLLCAAHNQWRVEKFE